MIDILNKITGILEWGEIAGIIAVLSAFLAIIYKILEYASAALFRRWRENSQPRIEVPLIIDEDDEVDFVVQTFRPNPNYKKTPYEEYWEKDKNFLVTPEQGVFIVDKRDILGRLIKPSYPYKFYLRMDRSILDKYYARMASCGLIVTGRGDEEETNNNLWRIWFLVSSEPQHPKIKDLWRVNHKL